MNVISIDVECSYGKESMHPWQHGAYLSAVGVAWANQTTKTWVFKHQENTTNHERVAIKEIQCVIDDADLIVGHNLKFDLNWLRHTGINVPNEKLFCTQVAEYMLRGQRKGIGYSLNDCCKRYKLPVKLDKVATYWEAGRDTDTIPLRILLPYLEQDCKITLSLWEKQKSLIESKSLQTLSEICFEVSGILSEAETNGFTLDLNRSYEIIDEYKQILDNADSTLIDLVGFEFNPGSNKQLSAALYGGVIKRKIKVKKEKVLKSGKIKQYEVWGTEEPEYDGMKITPLTDTESAYEGYYSTSKDTLKSLKTTNKKQEQFVDILVERSNAQKVLQTFHTERKGSSGLVDIVGTDGRVHPAFNQTVTATARLSSSRPNGQNLPRKGTSPVKQTVLSRNGRIINGDLAQIEWRMVAELSRDQVALREIKEGIDAHADNAIKFFGAGQYSRDSFEFKKLRTDAKIFLFRMIYGGTAAGFYRDRKMPDFTLERWKEIVDGFKKKYSRLVEWQEENIGKVLQTGRLVNFTNRVLTFPKVARYDGSYGPSDKAVCNYPVQSISADMIYIAMVDIMREVKRLGLKSEFILMVHDSMVFDAYENEIDQLSEIFIRVFENIPARCKELFGYEFEVPLTGDIELGLTYGDIVEYNSYTERGEKYLYSFEEDNKTQYMWTMDKQKIYTKHPQATNLLVKDTINPD
jgi:DNA polymerase-1